MAYIEECAKNNELMLHEYLRVISMYIMPIYIFMDESGSPGKAQYDNDFFLVAAVFVDGLNNVMQIQESIERFRKEKGYPEDFEFHFHRNSDKQKRQFLNHLKTIDFKYNIFVFRKDLELDYEKVARKVADYFSAIEDRLVISLDSNPHLRIELSKCLKEKKKKVRIRELRSQSSALIQIADYVAGISNKEIKSNHKDKYDSYLKLKKLP